MKRIITLSPEQFKELQNTIQTLIKSELKKNRNEILKVSEYMKKNELCKYLNKSNNTVNKLIAEGLPRINIKGVVLYNKDEIDEWLVLNSN